MTVGRSPGGAPVNTFRPNPTRCLWIAGALLGALVMAGCGESEDPRTVDELIAHVDGADPKRVANEINVLAARARANPHDVVPVLIDALRNYEGNRHLWRFEFQVADDALSRSERTAHVSTLSHMMPKRLRDWGYDAGVFQVVDDKLLVEVFRPRLDEAGTKRWTQNFLFRLTAPGTVQVRRVVTEPTADQESLWEGDRASYAEYLAEESRRLAQDLKAGRPFTPTRPRFRTVMRRPDPGTEGKAYAVIVYDPDDPTDAFDTRDLKVRGGLDPANGDVVLELRFDKTRHEHLRVWSTKHQGRMAAILLNGNAMHVLKLSPIKGGVLQRTVGSANNAAAMDWLKAFVASARTGPYPARISGRLLPNEPEHLDLPLAHALARVGAPAEPGLREVLREGGPTAKVAEWALGEITRRATGQKKYGK